MPCNQRYRLPRHADVQLGADALEQALVLAPGVLSDRYLGMAHDALATLASERGDWRQACEHLLQAQALQSRLSDAASSAALDAVYARVVGMLGPPPSLVANAKMPAPPSGPREGSPPLTHRQAQILMQVAAGRSNAEIADSLGISANTVRFHLSIVFSRLGARRRGEAAMIAMRMGLLSLDTRQ
jgi:DNA-binding CsgD family transcriptional regulator